MAFRQWLGCSLTGALVSSTVGFSLSTIYFSVVRPSHVGDKDVPSRIEWSASNGFVGGFVVTGFAVNPFLTTVAMSALCVPVYVRFKRAS